jgi:hypothetical protein
MKSSIHPLWIRPEPNLSNMKNQGEMKIPAMTGPPEVVERVRAALAEIREPGSALNVLETGRIKSFQVDADGSATLWLRLNPSHHHSAELVAERIFDVLRAELPDTDLYLHHETVGGPCSDAPTVAGKLAVASGGGGGGCGSAGGCGATACSQHPAPAPVVVRMPSRSSRPAVKGLGSSDEPGG